MDKFKIIIHICRNIKLLPVKLMRGNHSYCFKIKNMIYLVLTYIVKTLERINNGTVMVPYLLNLPLAQKNIKTTQTKKKHNYVITR